MSHRVICRVLSGLVRTGNRLPLYHMSSSFPYLPMRHRALDGNAYCVLVVTRRTTNWPINKFTNYTHQYNVPKPALNPFYNLSSPMSKSHLPTSYGHLPCVTCLFIVHIFIGYRNWIPTIPTHLQCNAMICRCIRHNCW